MNIHYEYESYFEAFSLFLMILNIFRLRSQFVQNKQRSINKLYCVFLFACFVLLHCLRHVSVEVRKLQTPSSVAVQKRYLVEVNGRRSDFSLPFTCMMELFLCCSYISSLQAFNCSLYPATAAQYISYIFNIVIWHKCCLHYSKVESELTRLF